uniref:E3 ubiquitin-protein ligase HERC2-like n=1 Tax=Phallusia mammillata TaxID=59560 RepID=A0A6F9DF68_9ASCI|nr:E3 ubiquitin-protein ligase HERC2-like [Phallusia mammillata]
MVRMSDIDFTRCYFTGKKPTPKWTQYTFQNIQDTEFCDEMCDEMVLKGILKQNESLPAAESFSYKSWEWGEIPDNNELQKRISDLQVEQQKFSHLAGLTSPSIALITKQLYVLAYHYRAVSISYEKAIETKSKHESDIVNTVKNDMPNSSMSKQVETTVSKKSGSSSSIVDRLSQVGSRFTLSFAFMFLRKMWRLGEDTDLCTEILQDTLDAFRELPVASLFYEHLVPPAWLEVIERSDKFLRSITQCSDVSGSSASQPDVPIHDQHLALNLLLELSLQRGTLSSMLDVVVFLLNMWESRRQLPDNRKESQGPNAPLSSFLQRLAQIQMSSFLPNTEGSASVACLSSNSSISPETKKEDDNIDMRQASVIIMSQLGRLSTDVFNTYMKRDTVDDAISKDEKSSADIKVYLNHNMVDPDILKENMEKLKVKQVAIGEKWIYFLSQSGQLYRLSSSSPTTQEPHSMSQEKFCKIASHPDALHLLALTSQGKVFSCGINDGGRLGHGDNSACLAPKMISMFGGNQCKAVDIACGSNYSAAITEKGELYTWGCGNFGRLGHNNSDDQFVPKLVVGLQNHRVVFVSCGTADAHTLALTNDGKVFSWGDGDHGKLGLGDTESKRKPMLVEALKNLTITKVHCGKYISLALSESGKLYGWGLKNSPRSDPLSYEFDDNILIPKLVDIDNVVDVGSVYGQIVVVTADGKIHWWNSLDDLLTNPKPWETQCIIDLKTKQFKGLTVGYKLLFILYKDTDCEIQIPQKLQFTIDTSTKAVKSLEVLLSKACSNSDHLWPSTQDKESFVISCIQLLQLQLSALLSDGTQCSEFQEESRTKSITNIKSKIVFLASKPGVSELVQKSAQHCLQVGWRLLLPTVEERAAVLSFLLTSSRMTSSGKVFMTDLLVKSLLLENNMETFLRSSVEDQLPSKVMEEKDVNEQEVTKKSKPDKQSKMESADFMTEEKVPLIRLIEQLMTCIQDHTTAELKLLAEAKKSTKKQYFTKKDQSESALRILTTFQKLIFSRCLSGNTKQACNKIIVRYMTLVCRHAIAVMTLASDTMTGVTGNTVTHIEVMKVLESDITGAILPGFVLSLLLLQCNKMFHKIVKETSVVLDLRKLFESLDKINQLNTNISRYVTSDLSWPGVTAFTMAKNTETSLDLPTISLQELENHIGWVVIGNLVYDQSSTSGGSAAELVGIYSKDKKLSTSQTVSSPSIFYHTQHCIALLVSSCASANNTELSHNMNEVWSNMKLFKNGLQRSNLMDAAALKELEVGSLSQQIQNLQATISSNPEIEEFLSKVASGCKGIDPSSSSNASIFLNIMKKFNSENSLLLPSVYGIDHPVEKTGQHYLSCLLKHHDLAIAAMTFVEHNPDGKVPNNIAQIFRMVHSFKHKVIHAHQKTKKPFKEMCSMIKERLRFLLFEVSVATTNPIFALNKQKMLNPKNRWRKAVDKMKLSGLLIANNTSASSSTSLDCDTTIESSDVIDCDDSPDVVAVVTRVLDDCIGIVASKFESDETKDQEEIGPLSDKQMVQSFSSVVTWLQSSQWTMLYHVIKDKQLMEALKQRMQGTNSLCKTISLEIEEFALKEGNSSLKLNNIREEILSQNIEIVQHYRSNLELLDLLQKEVLLPMQHTLFYGWMQPLPNVSVFGDPENKIQSSDNTTTHSKAKPPSSYGLVGNLMMNLLHSKIIEFATQYLRHLVWKCHTYPEATVVIQSGENCELKLSSNFLVFNKDSVLIQSRFLAMLFNILIQQTENTFQLNQVLQSGCPYLLHEFINKMRELIESQESRFYGKPSLL